MGVRCSAIARHTTTSTRITCTDSTRCDRPAQSGRLFHEQLIHHSSSAQASARVAAVEPVMNANASKRVRQYLALDLPAFAILDVRVQLRPGRLVTTGGQL